MILLTDKELARFPLPDYPKKLRDMKNDIAQAQLKKIAEWGNEECSGHEGYEYSLYRRQCSNCWRTLKKEVGL